MKLEKIFWGLLFITLAVVMIINPMGLLEDLSVIQILLGIILGAWFIKSVIHFSYAGILFSLAFLCIIFNKELDITNITPWPVLLAATFGTIGLHYLFPHSSHHYFKHKNKFNTFTTTETDETFNVDTSFGENIKYISSKNLKSGDIDCAFGSVKLYLDNAMLSADGTTINIDASFSGIEIYVPKDWQIVNKLYNTLSGVEEKNRSVNTFENCKNILTLVGNLSFSGVTIIYL